MTEESSDRLLDGGIVLDDEDRLGNVGTDVHTFFIDSGRDFLTPAHRSRKCVCCRALHAPGARGELFRLTGKTAAVGHLPAFATAPVEHRRSQLVDPCIIERPLVPGGLVDELVQFLEHAVKVVGLVRAPH
jgi:hypothetical protein